MGKFRNKQSSGNHQDVIKTSSEGKVKKPFDKAKWREQKYSNKAKINRFEERRRKTVLRDYYKELKKSGIGPNKSEAPGPSHRSNNDGDNQRKSFKPHEMARREAERLRQEQEKRRLEKQRILEERKTALAKYKNNKKDRFSKLSKKTKSGQPVMAGRMELLLNKIQKSM